MEFLVLAPPVCTPSEPPSGAFVLAAGLAGRGREVGMLDLSLELCHRVLDGERAHRPGIGAAVACLLDGRGGYEPGRHRSASGVLRGGLRGFSRSWPGWKLTPMDISPPWPIHRPAELARGLAAGDSPFEGLWEEALWPIVAEHRPAIVIISLAYLSQLPAAICLDRFLRTRGVDAVVGGSLPRSLAVTGHGLETLRGCFSRIDTSDGSSLLGEAPRGPFTDALAWPTLLSTREYLSAHPVVPMSLSTGCFWSRCLFCPDRRTAFSPVPPDAIDRLLSTVPAGLAARGPVIHLLDSAMPPALLRRFLPVARSHGVGFYGFARPDARLAEEGLLEEAAASGCLMLQLGVESGSSRLLDRFDKGLDPHVSARVMRAAAAAGIRVYAYLLFGLPGETEADRIATADLLESCVGSVDYLNLSLFNLPHHCELTDRAAEFGMELGSFPGGSDAIRLYRPFTCAGEDTRGEARRFVRDRLLAVEAVRAMHLRTPRWFRAAHLAMMRLDGRTSPDRTRPARREGLTATAGLTGDGPGG
jgi:hypothetical protein